MTLVARIIFDHIDVSNSARVLVGYKLFTGDTRKIFVSNICFKTVDESNSVRVLVGCKLINKFKIPCSKAIDHC